MGREAWTHYLNGLWLSGLRLEESLILSWDKTEPFFVDLDRKFPMFRIYAEAQRRGIDELLPMTPDFAEFIKQIPPAERVGTVFKLNGLQSGKPITPKRVCRILSAMGRRAGIVTNKERDEFASAHDLRRAFGSRWAKRVMPVILQKLMRHESIETTIKYYADGVAREIWGMQQPMPTLMPTLMPTTENRESPEMHASSKTP